MEDGFNIFEIAGGDGTGDINVAFVYCLIDAGSIVYIGFTRYIKERINYHRWQGKKFDSFGFKLMLKNDAIDEEMMLIRKHGPKYNTLHVSESELNRRKALLDGVGQTKEAS